VRRVPVGQAVLGITAVFVSDVVVRAQCPSVLGKGAARSAASRAYRTSWRCRFEYDAGQVSHPARAEILPPGGATYTVCHSRAAAPQLLLR
jgi:hypothetical protein